MSAHVETLPNLRDRAIKALERAEDARAAAEEEILANLREEAYGFLIEALEVDPGSASCAMFDAAGVTVNKSAPDKPHPSAPATNLGLLVKVDGQAIRFHFDQAKVMTVEYGDRKETIYEDELKALWRSPGGSFYPIRDLATLGQMIAEHVR